jgi:hypothetical protein
MPRTFAPAVLLAALALLSPGEAFAGPPEEVSGRMAFDEVADGLRKYRREADSKKRIEWLRKLAPTHDPRVGVALGEALAEENSEVGKVAAYLIAKCSYRRASPLITSKFYYDSQAWWKASEADLRRRAARLPR